MRQRAGARRASAAHGVACASRPAYIVRIVYYVKYEMGTPANQRANSVDAPHPRCSNAPLQTTPDTLRRRDFARTHQGSMKKRKAVASKKPAAARKKSG